MEIEKVKEIKKCLVFCKDRLCEVCPRLKQEPNQEEDCRCALIEQSLTLINELESENERLLNEKWDKEDDLDNYHEENKQLKDRIAELEEGIAQSMLGCEFLPECTKEIAEKIWNMSKITVDATKHIVQGREYLHLDALKEIIKSCGVEIKE